MNLTAVVMGAYGKIARNMVHSAKLVHQRLDKRGKVRVDGTVFHRSVASFSEEQVVTVSQFGIPRSPVVFCNRAVKCGHPRCMSLHLPEVVTQVLRDNWRWNLQSWLW